MKNCNTILSIHEGMGTTQTERLRPALQTNFFLIDERKEEDFILFIQRLSKYVSFYNEFDISDGDWSAFFKKESTAILIYIAGWNIEMQQSLFEVKKNEILLNANPVTQKAKLHEYFKDIETEFEKLVKSAETLDSEIPEKENLISSSYAIKNQFTTVLDLITASNDIPALLQNYVFVKSMQQLFGLLLSWKRFSANAITFQLNSYTKHTPHYALFLAFIKLMKVAANHFNEFTKRHLDFYYKDVLHTENQSASPDYVHLVLEPFNTKPFLVPKNTIFLAGKNSIGQKKFYASTADQTVNGIKLSSFCSYHRETDSFYSVQDLLKVNGKGKSFDCFTTKKEEFKEGLFIASPILFLQSGERIITLRFNDKNHNAADFEFYLTGEKKLIQVTEKKDVKDPKNQSKTHIQLIIPATEKAIIPYNAKLHPEILLNTDYPVLKIIPKNKSIIASVKTIAIRINVNQFKSFVLESDFGGIDVEKPFYPFGEFPKNDNGIILASNEFFMKGKASASIQIKTDKVIRIGRGQTREKKKDWIFDKVNIFNLDDGKWIVTQDKLSSITNAYPLKDLHFDEIITDEIVSNGKFRIELDYKDYEGEKYIQQYIKASADKEHDEPFPYKPRIKEFVFNYSVEETINLAAKADGQHNKVELYHILPFGYAQKIKGAISFSAFASQQGYIYLGFDKVQPQDGLTFLLQLEEGTANPQLQPASISWHYLTKNTWTEFEPNAIGDETRSLTQSGLVAVSIPEFEASKNTILKADLFWIRISVSNIQAVCKWMGIHVQALKAVLTDYDNIGTEFLEVTPKETISKLYSSIDGIKKIQQPYASFGGRLRELDNSLYTRTSERLRHKKRAITTWDYERIILQEFPEVYRVKALNHYRYDTKISNVAAGYVTLIPIAKSSPSENINWKPLLSLSKMLAIKEFLMQVNSPHARINVKPPKPEMVKVNFKVKFHVQEGMDTRLYIQQLMTTLNQYLSPWAYDTAEVSFAGSIEFSSVIQLLDNQPYVDYITDFKVDQYLLDENYKIKGSPIQNLNKITPQTDFTLFVPTETHQIKEI
ncbi:baseplate J/gp47 family protein [Flavobacterium amniphilum]|uniref:baseplate J/gp47 family protein n=1 Tax=Flavobacterium amniphilum TaxID=1834035 RepID=UPI00202A0B02|nr:baseplate J/gp47 family protein [Flavobacterium amniphilum]MCL9803998.1 baseplate J/gp47 family protein [Flavobacterium amniphilum]